MQAKAYAKANAWASAGQEYTAAAEVGGDPAHLLDAAEAFRQAPDLLKARAAYQAYLERVPLGANSDEIRGKVADLSLAIEKAKAEGDEQQRRLQQTISVREPTKAEPKADFELGLSLASGMKRQNDNPFGRPLNGTAVSVAWLRRCYSEKRGHRCRNAPPGPGACRRCRR